jgi:hypothetical protein
LKPTLYEALSDLTEVELSAELDGLLKRCTTLAELQAFVHLIAQADSFAAQRRRLTIRAIKDQSWPKFEHKPAVFTERESSTMSKLKPASASYPTAISKRVRTKDEERKILVYRIGQVVMACNFPASQLVNSSAAPERIHGRFGAGKRNGTLKAKVSAVNAMEKWMLVTYKKPFPTKAVELIDYLLDRAEEQCGPTVPRSITAAVSYGMPATEILSEKGRS